ncbi:hypothetical protein L6R49_02440 [Myxococcota bacterium]|nr:hypothetical protein [Myxococcota bacterium]
MSDGVQWILLGEDKQAVTFLRRLVVAMGANARRVIELPVAATTTGACGSQYVVARYARELPAFRANAARMSTKLLVHIDADDRTVLQRQRELAQACADAGLPPRGPNEAIALLIPKRNLETWIASLDPSQHDAQRGADPTQPLEERVFRHLTEESGCSGAVEALARHLRSRAPAPLIPDLPSLDEAVVELRRVWP